MHCRHAVDSEWVLARADACARLQADLGSCAKTTAGSQDDS